MPIVVRMSIPAAPTTPDDETIAPGDRWTHRTWPEGTPPAIVGAIDPISDYITWSQRGSTPLPGINARFLRASLGWSKVSA